ncbi:MAG TPA: histidine kinase [Thermoanaerobaculia bacterium]|nr:histidine kinase [Thermoanaerobaculia bacterium]
MSDTPASTRLSGRELAFIFLFWTALAAFSAVNRLTDPREGLRIIAPAGAIVMPFAEAWLWAALTPLIFWLSRITVADPGNRIAKVLMLAGAGIIIAIGVDMVLDLARAQLLPMPRRGRGGGLAFAPMRGIIRGRFLNQAMIYGGVLLAGFAREYFLRDRLLRVRAGQLEAQLAHARLDALRMQINPHFLFNTLHAISALVERDPAGVRKMIARLSDLLRQTLDRGPDEVPLRDEMEFLNKYLDIMTIRFQGRLTVTTSIDPAALDVPVPNFILQPVVENALEHGVSRASGEATIEISARREGQHLVLTIRDRGPGLAAGAPAGVGLSNTQERLETLYGDGASLRVTSPGQGGTSAEIRLPWPSER